MPKVQLSVGTTVTAAVLSLAPMAVPGVMTAPAPSAAAVRGAAWVTTGHAGSGAAQVPQLRKASAPGGPAASPGTQLWLERYNGPVSSDDVATSVAVSPDGGTVFVTGEAVRRSGSPVPVTNGDYVTIAYDAATGGKLWLSHWGSSQNLTDRATSVTVSPDGGTVFVTGSSDAPSGADYVTVAYNAATGAKLWARRYNGASNGDDFPSQVVATSNAVYVTGRSIKGLTNDYFNYDYLTVAYNAATGTKLWIRRYNGTGHSLDGASGVAASPGGDTVYVTGGSAGATSGDDYVTIAYDAATGTKRWIRRYNDPSNVGDSAAAVAVSPTTGTVFVTGGGAAGIASGDYYTIAYSPATGKQLWVTAYNGPANSVDSADALAVGPGGDTVYVTGESWGGTTSADYATVAYDAATGNQLWATRYDGPTGDFDQAFAVGVSPGGGTVYVTGGSTGHSSGGYLADYATVAYDTTTGNQLWAARYDGPGGGKDEAYSMAVSPITGTVFITGHSLGTASSADDYATIAYDG